MAETLHRKWPIPDRGADPYFEAFDRFVSAIDRDVNSSTLLLREVGSRVAHVNSAGRAYVTTVMSYFNHHGSEGVIVGSTGGAADWTTLSCWPHGAVVGSFMIGSSRHTAMLSLNSVLFFSSTGCDHPHYKSHPTRVGMRLVLTDGVNTVTLGDSQSFLWVNEIKMNHQMHWTLQASLGVGVYNATLQAVCRTAGTTASSVVKYASGSRVHVVLCETVPSF